jgi:hypothetical protein
MLMFNQYTIHETQETRKCRQELGAGRPNRVKLGSRKGGGPPAWGLG